MAIEILLASGKTLNEGGEPSAQDMSAAETLQNVGVRTTFDLEKVSEVQGVFAEVTVAHEGLNAALKKAHENNVPIYYFMEASHYGRPIQRLPDELAHYTTRDPNCVYYSRQTTYLAGILVFAQVIAGTPLGKLPKTSSS